MRPRVRRHRVSCGAGRCVGVGLCALVPSRSSGPGGAGGCASAWAEGRTRGSRGLLRLLCGSGIASAGAELADGVVHKGGVHHVSDIAPRQI